MRRWVGLPVGVLIGAVSGIWTLFIMMDAFRPPPERASWFGRVFGSGTVSGFKVAAKLTGLPALWFGGRVITTPTLSKVLSWDDALLPYATGVAVIYLIIVAYPTIRLIIRLGELAGNLFNQPGPPAAGASP